MHHLRTESVAAERTTAATAITLRSVSKAYDVADGLFTALAGVDLDVQRGEFVTVVGRSGSGKTTLLNLLAGIDVPTAGQITIDGQRVDLLQGSRLSAWRGTSIGLVFQFFQLLPTLTVAENVMLPMDFCNTFPTRARRASSTGSASSSRPTSPRRASPEGSSSGPRSPGHWRTTLRCSWPMSPRATSTPPRVIASSTSSRDSPPRVAPS
jgi:ABC-type sugar transport system ATPase subunit